MRLATVKRIFMNNIRTLVAALTLPFSLGVQAEINRVTLNKVSPNLYQTSDGAYIETNNCFADAKGIEAVLKFERYACNNNLRFSEQAICEVIDVFK